MKILFLTDGIHPFQLGGMQKHSLIMTRLLAEREVWMRVYHNGGSAYSPLAFEANYGAEFKHITECCIEWPELDNFPGHYIRENKRYSELIYNDCKDILNEFDLVYAQGFTGWHFIKEKKKGNISIPILVNFHGFEMFQAVANFKSKVEQFFFRKAVKFNVLNADGVYSFGGHIDRILHDLGVAKDKIILQSNGIQSSWLTSHQSNDIRNQKRTLTFIGRNERRKGIEELNEALKELIKREDLLFHFNFVGPIPEEIQIKDERIHYHGEIRDAEKIKEILQHSDCLVCPSHSEGMPTVILEGMASGLAIIATDVGAVSRQVKSNGILLERPEPALLRKALLNMIEINDEELNHYKKASIEMIHEHFLWEVIADKTVAQFRRMLSFKK